MSDKPVGAIKSPRVKSVRVKVLGCRGVLAKAALHVKLATNLGECKTEPAKPDGGKAVWSKVFTIACEGVSDTLHVAVKAERKFGSKSVGELALPCKRLRDGAQWYKLEGGQGGELELHLTANGFMPLSRSAKGVPLAPAELERQFAELVKNLAIANDQQREAMFQMPAEMKWNMLKQAKKEKAGHAGKAGRIEDKPEYWTNKLQVEPSRGLLAELRVLLSTSPLSWLERFIELDGVVLLVGVLSAVEIKAINHIDDKRFRHTKDDLAVEAECVRCLRMIMNNEVGLRAVLRTQGAVHTLCLALDSNGMDARTKSTILKLLTVTCMLPPDGHRVLLRAMNEYRLLRNAKHRFVGLIKALKKATTVEQQLGYMYLINALINSPSDIDLRVAIRNEFVRLGINDIVARLKQQNDAELELQIDVFEEETNLDQQEIKERFDHLELDVDDADEVFTALLDKLRDTGLSDAFQSILRNLLLIPPDTADGQKLWLLVARFVRQVSVQREAIGATDDNEIQLDTLLVTVEDEANDIDKAAAIEKLKRELNETKDKLRTLQSEAADQLKLLEAKDALLKDAAAGGGVKLDGAVTTQAGGVALPGGGAGDDAPITGGPPIAPPPGPGAGGDAPITGGPPIAPPPMMGGGGGAAPVGGGPPPPPPPMMIKKFKWKLTPAPKQKLKGFQWVKLPAKDADKTVFKQYQEAPLDGFKLDFGELEGAFAIKKLSSKVADAKKANVAKDEGTVNLLDGKISQNLSIWLSQYKGKSHAQIVRGMLQLDTTMFTAASIKTLLSTLPGKDGERAVQGFLTDGGDAKRLGTPEKFTLELAKVANVEALLQAFLFVLEFDGAANDVKPAIEAIRLASREVFASKRFARLLQIVMWLGNFMNGSTARGDAPGFKLESLNKIEDTKTTDNKHTLLYFLVRQIQSQDAALLSWPDDLKNVYAAARVALPQLTSDVKQLKDGVGAVKQAKQVMPAEHRSLHTKLEAFLLKADTAVSKLVVDKDKMVKGYEKMTEQYGVNGKKTPPDEFFGMLQKFADRFKANVKQIELDVERAAKEEKRTAAKAAKLAEFKKKQAEVLANAAKSKKLRATGKSKSGGKKKPASSSASSSSKRSDATDDPSTATNDNDDDDDASDSGSSDDGMDDDDGGGAPASMFESMMSSLQAGEAFASRRKR